MDQMMQERVGCAKLEVEPGADAMVGATLVGASVRGLVHAATTVGALDRAVPSVLRHVAAG
ncbi:hypothetical protein PUR34_12385 [Streptomyces sp. JV185]|uniref:hypothetical protein n=1 Tax=Streptomyces sp. JV185 TaxID=858638 RepID=UPI002E795110|nr:hypothetical protein [Streptomyces sp. JV185]MEE1768933.1 hypothetical protein [Streptomyces sp. JV185]